MQKQGQLASNLPLYVRKLAAQAQLDFELTARRLRSRISDLPSFFSHRDTHREFSRFISNSFLRHSEDTQEMFPEKQHQCSRPSAGTYHELNRSFRQRSDLTSTIKSDANLTGRMV